jgi:hypothetical protein
MCSRVNKRNMSSQPLGRKFEADQGFQAALHVAIAAGHERIEAVRATVQLKQRRTNLPPVRPGRLNS